jgi:hypothetical protein
MGAATFSRDEDGDPVYAFRVSLTGATCRFAIKPEALYWESGRRAGRIRYERIRAVRLSYRPVTMQSHRFVADIWSTDNPKVQIVSVSWRSVVQQERLDAQYRAFIAELHRRLAAAGGSPQFIAGLPVAIYWFGAVVFAGVLVASAALTVRAIRLGAWSATAVILAFLAMFLWQFSAYFRRNRPGRYRPDAIPAALLPDA